MTDYWKKYDETYKWLHPDEMRSETELKNHILDEFFDGEPRYNHSAYKLAHGLWRVKPYKEGVRRLEGYVDVVTFHRETTDRKGVKHIRKEQRHVVRDEKGRFKKWL